MTKCKIDGCMGEANLPGTAQGLCRSHYKRYIRYGSAEVELRKVATWKGQKCWVKSCGRKIMANGICEMHYARARRKTDPLGQKRRNDAYVIRQRAKREAEASRPKPLLCEICNELHLRIVFDHCHNHGHFRGWICDRCNKVLGLVYDSSELLHKLARYLYDGIPQDGRGEAKVPTQE